MLINLVCGGHRRFPLFVFEGRANKERKKAAETAALQGATVSAIPSSFSRPLTRRELLQSSTFGVGTVALAWLLNQERLLSAPSRPELEKQVFDLKAKDP